MAKKTNAELLAENRLLRRSNAAIGVISILNTLIKFGTVVLVARYIYLSIGELAGKETIANVLIKFVSNLTVSQSLAYIFGGGALLYGAGERAIRKRTIKRLQGRITQLETSKDPRRTSSNLTERGETNPRDRQ